MTPEHGPSEAVLERMSSLAPREMRRALMTGFGNARLDGRGCIQPEDLPRSGSGKSKLGFLQ